MNFKVANFVFLKNRLADLKTNYQAVTFGINDYLYNVSPKMSFLFMIQQYFENNVQFLANELKRCVTA